MKFATQRPAPLARVATAWALSCLAIACSPEPSPDDLTEISQAATVPSVRPREVLTPPPGPRPREVPTTTAPGQRPREVPTTTAPGPRPREVPAAPPGQRPREVPATPPGPVRAPTPVAPPAGPVRSPGALVCPSGTTNVSGLCKGSLTAAPTETDAQGRRVSGSASVDGSVGFAYVVGDTEGRAPGNGYSHTFLSFDLSGVPAGAVVDTATLNLYQSACPAGNDPYTQLGGNPQVDSVDYGATLEGYDLNAAVPLIRSAAILPGGQAREWKTVSVSNAVAADLLARTSRGSRSQFRIRFPMDRNADGGDDRCAFGPAAPWAPRLDVTFSVPR